MQPSGKQGKHTSINSKARLNRQLLSTVLIHAKNTGQLGCIVNNVKLVKFLPNVPKLTADTVIHATLVMLSDSAGLSSSLARAFQKSVLLTINV
jgi:hypothetical protein